MALRDIQSNIQKAKAARDKQLAASTVATQSGGTSTPTTTETPKVVQTPKPVQSTIEQRTTNNISNIKSVRSAETNSTPNLKDINLFKIQDVTKTSTQSKDLLTQNDKADSPTITSELAKMYDTLPDNMRKPVDDAIENNAKKILYSL
jgi:hypothetical protein